MRRSRLALPLVLAAASVLCAGCLFSNRSEVRYAGKKVDEGLLARITAGKTTREELVRELGQPTSTERRGDSEILRYKSSIVREQESGFLFLFHNESRKEEAHTVFFEFRNGVLQQSWTE